jgi:prevent-host-death family protein
MAEPKTMKASEVRERWSETVDAIARDGVRIRIERSGTPIAALVSARDLAWLALRDRQLEELRAAISQMRATFAVIPEEELDLHVADVLAEVRAEQPLEPTREPSTNRTEKEQSA